MSKPSLPLAVPDISDFARALSLGISQHATAPSHLTMLNLCAKAAGFRNYQHFKAAHATHHAALDAMPEGQADYRFVTLTARQFTDTGIWARWPSKTRQQEAGLWVMWSVLPKGVVMQEPEVNARLNALHTFNDAAILRRSLVGMDLLQRNRDGSDYIRREQAPSPDARALIGLIKGRRVAAR